MPVLYQRAHLRDIEPDRLRDVLRGGRVEHVLLEPVTSGAVLQRWETDDLSIDRGRYGFAVIAHAEFRPGFFGLGHATSPTESTLVNGFAVRERDLQAYPEGSEILYRANAGAGWTLMQLRREAIQRRALERLGRELELPDRHVQNLRLSPRRLAELRSVVNSLLGEQELPEEERASADVQRHVLVDAVVDLLDRPSCRAGVARRALDAERRTEAVFEAQRLLRDQDAGPYDSTSVCATLGLPERTLQLYFRQTLGISPRDWQRIDRLHRARRLLLGARDSGRRVTDVAMHCGFEQLGRFSTEYRRLFGEKPVETLRSEAAGSAGSAPPGRASAAS